MKKTVVYFWNVLRWLDCGLNCIVLLGSYNQTLSNRAARARDAHKAWGCVLCRLLDAINTNHCDEALKEYVGEDSVI